MKKLILLAAAAAVGYASTARSANQAEQDLWNEATRALDLR